MKAKEKYKEIEKILLRQGYKEVSYDNDRMITVFKKGKKIKLIPDQRDDN